MTVIRTLFAAAAAAAPCACSTGGAVALIETTPAGAEARLADGRYCTTPCTLRMSGQTRLSIAKTGYKTRTVELTPSPLNLYTRLAYDLELISASKPVEVLALPSVDAAPAATAAVAEPELIDVAPEGRADGDAPRFVMEPIGRRDEYAPPADESDES